MLQYLVCKMATDIYWPSSQFESVIAPLLDRH